MKIEYLSKAELINNKSMIMVSGLSNKKKSNFILDILKIENSFCKSQIQKKYGLDFEAGDKNGGFRIKIKGKSGEEFMSINISDLSDDKNQATIYFDLNDEYFPLKKELIEKRKFANTMLFDFIQTSIS